MLLDAQTDQTNTWVPLDPARTQLRRAHGQFARDARLKSYAGRYAAAKPLAIETNDFGGSTWMALLLPSETAFPHLGHLPWVAPLMAFEPAVSSQAGLRSPRAVRLPPSPLTRILAGSAHERGDWCLAGLQDRAKQTFV